MVQDCSEVDSCTTQLMKLADEHNVDLLHLNMASQAAGLPRGIPVVVASHSCVPTWWQAVHCTNLPDDWAWHHHRNQLGLQRADIVLAPSNSHADALRQTYNASLSVHVVYNGTDVAPSDKSKQAFILSVGRWWDVGKNGEILDAAASQSPWPIRLVGAVDGPNGQRAAFRYLRMLGPFPRDAVIALMREAAIFAAPSFYEPFGLAVAEAAMAGAAGVLADIPTFRELWSGAAVFVDANDAPGWSRAFCALAADQNTRHRLGRSAKNRASRLTLDQQVQRIHELHSMIISSVSVA